MIISHSKRFIFVHIYKVAGTSIKTALKPYADVIYRKYTLRRVLYVLRLLDSIGEHATALQIRERVSADVFEDYFKFAFVRNPWDWQVSLYHYIRSHRFHPEHREVKLLSGFPEYVAWRTANDRVLQKDFVTDRNGNLLVDFLGRFENLSADFASICARIGVNEVLPHRNASPRSNYTRYYDNQTAGLIAKHYWEDVRLFGYRFAEGVGP